LIARVAVAPSTRFSALFPAIRATKNAQGQDRGADG
jgi:hypothetical protein